MKKYLVRSAVMRSELINAETIQEVDQHMRGLQSAYRGTPNEFLLLSIVEVAIPEQPPQLPAA